MVDLVDDFFVDQFFKRFEIQYHSGFRVHFPSNSNLQNVIVSVPVWVIA